MTKYEEALKELVEYDFEAVDDYYDTYAADKKISFERYLDPQGLYLHTVILSDYRGHAGMFNDWFIDSQVYNIEHDVSDSEPLSLGEIEAFMNFIEAFQEVHNDSI